MAMSQLKTHISIKLVCEKLVKDPELMNSWEQFSTRLGTPPAQFIMLQRMFRSGTIEMWSLLSELLSDWVDREGNEATNDKLETILEQMEYGQRDQSENKNCSKIQPIKFGVVDAVHNFIGRQNELHQLGKMYSDKSPKLVVVNGLGGMGKTQLVKKFVSGVDMYKTNVFWLQGESPDSLRYSIKTLANTLKVPTTVDGEECQLPDILTKCWGHLEFKQNPNPFPVIVAIDNVDIAHSEFCEVAACLVTKLPNTFVIVTSRKRDILKGQFRSLKLSPLAMEDAMNFVKSELGPEPPVGGDHARSLCITLQCLPLTLQQAVAFIREQQDSLSVKGSAYSISDYLLAFETKQQEKEVLSKSLEYLDDYEKVTLTVWDLTVQTITSQHGEVGQLAYDALETLAFINPDGIGIEFLNTIISLVIAPQPVLPVPNSSSLELFQNSILLLKAYSMINLENCIVSIHRLVQKVTRIRSGELPSLALGEATRWTEILTTLLTKLDPLTLAADEIPHALAIWNHTATNSELVTHRPQFLNAIVTRLYNLSLIYEAYDTATRSLCVLQQVIGDSHPESLKIEQFVAEGVGQNGDLDQALSHFKSIYQRKKTVFGEKHEETLVTVSNISGILVRQQNMTEALTWLHPILHPALDVFGPTNPFTMSLIGRLASIQETLGNTVEAYDLWKRLFRFQNIVLGKNHPDTLGTRLRLVTPILKASMWDVAKAEIKSIYEATMCGPGISVDYAGTVMLRSLLASTLWDLGERGLALDILGGVLSDQEIIFGKPHQYTQKTKERLGKMKTEYALEHQSPEAGVVAAITTDVASMSLLDK